MKNALQELFKKESIGQLRTVTANKEFYFSMKDIADALEYVTTES